MSNGGQQQQQRPTYAESHALAHAALQQHMAQQAAQARLAGPGPPAAPQPPNPTFTLPDDGLGYDDGVRVLRSIGTWCVKCDMIFRLNRGQFLIRVFLSASIILCQKQNSILESVFRL